MPDDSNELQQQIERRIDELPADVQQAILSSDLGDKILEIGASAKLHIDQIQNLNDLAMLSMLGFMPLNTLESEISKQLNLPPDTAKKVAVEVNQQIFLPIQESIKNFSSSKQEVTSTATPGQKPALSQVLPKESISIPVQTAPAAPISAPAMAPKAAPAPATTPAPLPAISKIDMHPADIALTQKTVATPAPTAPSATPAPAKPAVDAKTQPPKPTDYKADPYREPIS